MSRVNSFGFTVRGNGMVVVEWFLGISRLSSESEGIPYEKAVSFKIGIYAHYDNYIHL